MRLILSQRSLRLSSVLFILFTLFCSSEIISTILSSSSLIRSSASDILLLIPSRVFCLENPRDGRAWWAAIYGVAKSQTQLKRLSSSSSSSRVFLISVIVLFISECLFFNSSRSLLIHAFCPFCLAPSQASPPSSSSHHHHHHCHHQHHHHHKHHHHITTITTTITTVVGSIITTTFITIVTASTIIITGNIFPLLVTIFMLNTALLTPSCTGVSSSSPSFSSWLAPCLCLAFGFSSDSSGSGSKLKVKKLYASSAEGKPGGTYREEASNRISDYLGWDKLCTVHWQLAGC